MLDLLISTVGQGLQWSVLALGVFLTFRILDIADLSVEGSFPLGAAAAATGVNSQAGGPFPRGPRGLPLRRSLPGWDCLPLLCLR